MEKENKLAQSEQSSNSLTGWDLQDKKRIADAVIPLMETQKLYGKEINAKLLMQAWENKFSKRFTVDQILYALDAYTDRHDDFPTPANLITILQPAEPQITQSQFIAAQDWQKRNKDYSAYTPEAILIADYRKQNDEKKEVFQIGCEKVKALAGNTLKRISNVQLCLNNQKERVMKITLIDCEDHLVRAIDTLTDWVDHKEYPQHTNLGSRNCGIAVVTLSDGTELYFRIWKNKQGWTIRKH